MRTTLHQNTRAGLGCLAALVLLIGAPLGLLLFGLMAITGYAGGNYEFLLIGLAAISAIIAGLYCLCNPPRRVL